MAWTPAAKIIDLVPVADNLLAYIQANQTDALEWANGGPGLNDFAKLYTNASGRLQTMFPSLMILAQAEEPDIAGEVLLSGLQLTLEGTISGGDADQLVLDTKKYAKAVASMLMNIPSASLMAGTDDVTHSQIHELETKYDILRGQQGSTAFLQIFQIRCLYALVGRAY